MSKFPCLHASLTNKHTEWEDIKWRQCRHFAKHLRQLTRTTRQLNASSSFVFKFHFTTSRNFTHTQSTDGQTDKDRNTESERERGAHTQCQYWNLRAAVLCQIFCSPSTSCACCVIFSTMAQRTFINLLAFPTHPHFPYTLLTSVPSLSPLSTLSHPYLSWKFDSEKFSTIAVHFSAIALHQISTPRPCPTSLHSPNLT